MSKTARKTKTVRVFTKRGMTRNTFETEMGEGFAASEVSRISRREFRPTFRHQPRAN